MQVSWDPAYILSKGVAESAKKSKGKHNGADTGNHSASLDRVSYARCNDIHEFWKCLIGKILHTTTISIHWRLHRQCMHLVFCRGVMHQIFSCRGHVVVPGLDFQLFGSINFRVDCMGLKDCLLHSTSLLQQHDKTLYHMTNTQVIPTAVVLSYILCCNAHHVDFFKMEESTHNSP